MKVNKNHESLDLNTAIVLLVSTIISFYQLHPAYQLPPPPNLSTLPTSLYKLSKNQKKVENVVKMKRVEF